MASFSATDAAFEGFRLTREQPKTLLIWAGFNLIIGVLGMVILFGMGGEAFRTLAATSPGPEADPTEALAAMAQLGPAYLFMLVVSIVSQAMLGAAVYRAVLRPSDGGIGYLKFGGDELRLIGLSLIYVVLFAVGTALAVLASNVAASLARGLLGSGGAGALAGVAVGLFVLGLMIFVVVRLSLAGVVTFARRRISVFGSWGITRGHFWGMVGTYVLTVASVIVIALLALIIFAALAAILSGGDLAAVGSMFSPDMTSFATYMTPTMVAYTVFGALLNAVYYAAIFSPHAVIYRALTGDAEAEVFA